MEREEERERKRERGLQRERGDQRERAFEALSPLKCQKFLTSLRKISRKKWPRSPCFVLYKAPPLFQHVKERGTLSLSLSPLPSYSLSPSSPLQFLKPRGGIMLVYPQYGSMCLDRAVWDDTTYLGLYHGSMYQLYREEMMLIYFLVLYCSHAQ